MTDTRYGFHIASKTAMCTFDDYAILVAAGTPFPPGTTVIDPNTNDILGVTDGLGNLAGLTSREAELAAFPVRNPVVLYEGDSITARMFVGVTDHTWGIGTVGTTLPTTPAAANANAFMGNASYVVWERFLSGGLYALVDNGVSGDTIEICTARLMATDLSPYDCVSLMIGMNNVLGSSSVDATSDFALYIIPTVEFVAARKLPMRICTVTPRGTGAWNGSERAYWQLFNTLLRGLPQTYANVFIGDSATAINDPTQTSAAPITGTISDSGTLNVDQTHPSTYGSALIAQQTLPSLFAALRWAGFGNVIDSRRDVYTNLGGYTEKFDNTDFVTQTGGFSSGFLGTLNGTVPSHWRIVGGNAASTTTLSYPWYIPDAKRQRGNWLTARAYLPGDGVTDPGTNFAYVCLLAHTSGTFATDYTAGDWLRVYCTAYCWQLDFTASAAAQTLDIRRAPGFEGGVARNDIHSYGCFLAIEGALNIRRLDLQSTGKTSVFPSNGNSLYDLSASATMGGTFQCPGLARLEGLIATPRAVLFADSHGTMWGTPPNFQLTTTSENSTGYSLIIYRPFCRVYSS